MSSEAGFRPKSPDKLSKQLESAQKILGAEHDSSLIPPSQQIEPIGDSILGIPLEEIKAKYGLRYEMYVDLVRHQKSLDANIEMRLSEVEIAEMKKWLTALNSLDIYITKHYGGEKTLRGRQINVFEDLKQFLENGKKKGYVKLPTGVGKTVLFTEFIEALNLKTLIVVPRKILVKQTAEKIEEFAPELEYGKVFGAAQEFGRQVTIITYDSLLSKLESGELNSSDYDAVMLDEAHEALGPKRQEALKKFDKQLIVGFTATPNFSERKRLSNILPDEIHTMTVKEGVEENMLCSISSIVVHTEADLSAVEIDKEKYSEKQLEQAVNIESRNQAAVKLYKNRFNGELALAYCVGVTHAEKVADEFNKAGIPAMAISGKTKRKDQERTLQQFKDGEIKVLCNADLLIQGFDEPKASVCFNLRPTKSLVDAEQRGGRALRINENNPNKHAYVVDFLDKGITAHNVPVLFADVIDGAVFINSAEREKIIGNNETENIRQPFTFIDIPGLNVTYDAQEIMKLVANLREEREKMPERIVKHTEEIALARLEEAFKTWSALPTETRGAFNARWFIDHELGGLYSWAVKTYGSVEKLVEKSDNQYLRDSFSVMKKSDAYTETTALARLEEAFTIWDSLPPETRGKFNANWLRKNQFSGVFNWAKENLSLEELVDKSSSEELKKNFESLERYTTTTALEKLEMAFSMWSTLPPETRGRFNSFWLKNNGLTGVINWCRKNTPLDELINRSENQELKNAFEKRPDKYTEATALARLESYFATWEALPQETRGKFNITWLLTQPGFNGLYDWTKSNTAMQDLVAKSNNQVLQDSFEKEKKSEKLTAANVLPRLEAAFAIWNSLPPDQRPNFNASWLIDNGFSAIPKWCNKNIRLSELVASSTNEVLKDSFTSDEDRYHTEVSVLALIEAGFAAWQALPVETRGKFNPTWLSNNGYNSAVDWCTRKKISLEDIVVKSENKALRTTFENRKKRKT